MTRQLVVLFLMMLATTGALYSADTPPASQSAAALQTDPKVAGLMAKATERGQRNATDVIASRDPAMSLSENQKMQITDICIEYHKAKVEFDLKNAPTIRAINAAMEKARQAEDQETLNKAHQDLQELRAAKANLLKKYENLADKIFTAKQKAKWDDWELTKEIEEMLAPVKLTDQQMKALKAATNGLEKSARGSAVEEAAENILTPRQLAQVKKRNVLERLNWKFYEFTFSPEQIKQAEAFCDKTLKESHPTVDELFEQLAEKMETLLTPEQKEARKKTNQEQ